MAVLQRTQPLVLSYRGVIFTVSASNRGVLAVALCIGFNNCYCLDALNIKALFYNLSFTLINVNKSMLQKKGSV